MSVPSTNRQDSDVLLFFEQIRPGIAKGMSPDEIARDVGVEVSKVRQLIDRFETPYCQRDGPKLFKIVCETIVKHVYLPEPWHYVICTLFVFQTKIARLLPVLFYIYLGGAKGSGKTNILELLRRLTNGIMCENISVKALAELMRDAPAVFIDEADVERGELTEVRNALLRQGYKASAAPYRRWDVKTNSEIAVPIYAPKAATFRGTLPDDALLDRGFLIPTAKVKGEDGYNYVRQNLWPDVGDLPDKLDAWGKSANEAFTPERLKEIAFSDSFREKVRRAVAELGANRESELVTIALLVAEVIGVDVVEEISQASETRLASDESHATELEALREVIIELSGQQHQRLLDASPVFRIKQSMVRKELNEKLRELGMPPISDRRLSILREELGIDRTMIVRPGNAIYYVLPEHFLRDLANKPNLANFETKPVWQGPDVSHVSQVSPPSLAEKIAEAQRLSAEGRDEMEIEMTVGPEVLRHCYEKGLIPRLGGRPK